MIESKPSTVYSPVGDEPDVGALAQFDRCLADDRAVAGALMADHHLGYSMPIGGVIAYQDAISPSGVGFDIGCGNNAAMTALHEDDLLAGGTLAKVMDDIARRVSFGLGRTNPTPIDHPLFADHHDVLVQLDKLAGRRMSLSQKARAQLGTVGTGNHYVDLLVDEHGRVWAADHFGSRGLGHTIATGALNLAHDLPFDTRGRERDEPTVIDVGTDLGQFYLAAMQLAGEYAHAGRAHVIDEVLMILGTPPVVHVKSHHNYAWHEDGLWVVRKGATPIGDELAYIGGSMGDGAVIVRARDGYDTADALASAPHGAGRRMSRSKAAGKMRRSTRYGCSDRDHDYSITAQEFDAQIRAVPKADRAEQGVRCPVHHGKLRRYTHLEQKTKGVVDWDATRKTLVAQGVELRGGAADEAPQAYKNLDDVIAAHHYIEIVHRLRPIGVAMAPPDVADPYKD